MSRVFMDFAASGEILFEARCGAKDFFDSLRRTQKRPSFLVQKILGPQPDMGIQMRKRIPGVGIQPAGCAQSG